MNFFGIHICQDEIAAFFMCIPFVGFVVNWVRSRAYIWRTRHTANCQHGNLHAPEHGR